MTNDDLRALADALSVPHRDLATVDVIRAADYLRAQADAQPVAWIAHNLTTGHVKWTTDRCRAHGWIQGGNLRVKSLYTHPAPAAPQAEPQEENIVWKQIIPDDVPQAEPKREPLSEATALIEWPESAKWKNRAAPEGIERSCMGEPKREPLSDERIAEIQRAAYERAAQECIETAAELRRCADGCTDGRYDWKADGADDCADAIRALGRQHD